ncbi:unnamed protein product, partial [Brachionus calyciflorus]
LELSEPIQFSKKVLPICLPDEKKLNFILDKETVIWDVYQQNQTYIPRESKLYTPSKCEISDPNVYCSTRLENQDCYRTGAEIIFQEESKWFLYGITTYPENILNQTSCDSSLPVYNLKIPRFLKWIKTNMIRKGEIKYPLIKYKIDTDCGVPVVKPLRIVNGQKAVPYSWPWSVPIVFFNKTYSYICAGTIISNNFILTAAHCFYPPVIDQVYISTETYDRTKINKNNTLKVKRWIIHKNYNDYFLKNDIALLELEKPLTFTDRVKKACLPLSNDVTTVFNKKLYIAA